MSPNQVPGYDQMIEGIFCDDIASQISFSQSLGVSILAYIGNPPEEVRPWMNN